LSPQDIGAIKLTVNKGNFMKNLALITLFIIFTTNPAQANTERSTFLCVETGERIDVKSSLFPGGVRVVSAEGSTIGSLSQVDCNEASQSFQSPGVGDICLVSESKNYLFNFYGNLTSATEAVFQKLNGGFDVCYREKSSPVQ